MTPADHEDIDFTSFPELSAATLPAEDQSALASLSTSEILDWVDERVEDYRRRITGTEEYIATLNSLRNGCAPVSRLPNEVLGRIFSHWSVRNRDLCIRKVCRRWRSVWLETPQVWVNRISCESFGWPLSRQTFLRVALRRSGALPLCISINQGRTGLWSIVLPHRSRIAVLAAEAFTLSALALDFLRSGDMDRLHTLHLKDTDLPDGTLIDILEACPRLKNLDCEASLLCNSERVVDLPHLRELTIRKVFLDARQLAPLLRSISAHTRVNFHLDTAEKQVAISFEFPQVWSPPLIKRLCVESVYDSQRGHGWIGVARGCLESGQQLRFSAKFSLFLLLEPLFRSISTLLFHFDAGHGELYKRVIREWNLPHLRRLEISRTTPNALKRTLTTLFLDRLGHRASELSVAWVLPSMPGQDDRWVAASLESLTGLLQSHIDSGKPRLGTLELYAVDAERYGTWEASTEDIKADTDARLCAKLVAPFLAKLQGVADVVHIG